MCGIIGYTGNNKAAPILLQGLKSLEYRGYDSAGLGLLSPKGKIIVHRAAGKLSSLVTSIGDNLPLGSTGIGHTRLATLGSPSVINSHPIQDCNQEIIVVHNGLVEYYLALKELLLNDGHKFTSDTDSEVIPHLIENYLSKKYSLKSAVLETAAQLKGAHAVVAFYKNDPSALVAFRLGNAGGLVLGIGENETYVGSDLPAFLPHTRNVVYLRDQELAYIKPNKVTYFNLKGDTLNKELVNIPYNYESVAKGNYSHFMLKEIEDQAEAVISSLRSRVDFESSTLNLESFPFSDKEIQNFNRVIFVGMGTSFNAATVGKFWMESLAGIQADADNSSEFRYRNPILNSNTLVVAIGQSGETADTLGAMEEAIKGNARVITICNVEGSQATHLAEWTLHMRAGMEVGVASTKTFTTSLINLYLLCVYLGIKRKVLSENEAKTAITHLASLPSAIGNITNDHSQYQNLAKKLFKHPSFLFLGRGLNYPIAMEGALKLKEVSYIHAEGYPAGEMKHGPIALIDENLPVVALVTNDESRDKMLNNISEVKVRGGIVISVTTEGDDIVANNSDYVLSVPKIAELLSPIVTAIPLQLLAYYIAILRGCDVDQPRNLAKSVTVE